MKNVYIVFFFLFFSCSDNHLQDIKDVEYFLGTNIPNYIDIKSSTEGLRQSIKIIDITLTKKEYELLIKRINLKEYDIYHNNYYKNYYYEKEKKHIYMTLYPEEYRIKYTEKF